MTINQSYSGFDVADNYDPFEDAMNPPMPDESGPGPMPKAKTFRPRYVIRSAADALEPQPPIEWIVEGLIEAGTLSAFFGEPGCKKTWSLLDMAVCVALGDQWLNFKTTKSHILVIDEESGERRLMRRLGDVLRGHQADRHTPTFTVSFAGFDFGKPSDLAELTNLIMGSNARLVIIDALSDVSPGRDENATKEMKPILLALKRIADDTQTAIILIHHANKQGNYRGSSTIRADVDTMIKVESDQGKDLIRFEPNKIRDNASFNFSATANFMTLDPKEFWLTAAANSPQSKLRFTPAQKYVLKYLLKHGNSKIDDIEDNADVCKPDTARKAVYSLAGNGFAERTNTGGRGVIAEYQLTQKGQDEAKKL